MLLYNKSPKHLNRDMHSLFCVLESKYQACVAYNKQNRQSPIDFTASNDHCRDLVTDWTYITVASTEVEDNWAFGGQRVMAWLLSCQVRCWWGCCMVSDSICDWMTSGIRENIKVGCKKIAIHGENFDPTYLVYEEATVPFGSVHRPTWRSLRILR